MKHEEEYKFLFDENAIPVFYEKTKVFRFSDDFIEITIHAENEKRFHTMINELNVFIKSIERKLNIK